MLPAILLRLDIGLETKLPMLEIAPEILLPILPKPLLKPPWNILASLGMLFIALWASEAT
jgi:hypothetical protein